jgi:hypothetical protein
MSRKPEDKRTKKNGMVRMNILTSSRVKTDKERTEEEVLTHSKAHLSSITECFIHQTTTPERFVSSSSLDSRQKGTR